MLVRTQQDRSRRKRQRRPSQEADEDAIFAAELLGLVHDRVRDAGDLLRIVGDTAGGLAGGSIKLLSAPVKVSGSCKAERSRGCSRFALELSMVQLNALDDVAERCLGEAFVPVRVSRRLVQQRKIS